MFVFGFQFFSNFLEKERCFVFILSIVNVKKAAKAVFKSPTILGIPATLFKVPICIFPLSYTLIRVIWNRIALIYGMPVDPIYQNSWNALSVGLILSGGLFLIFFSLAFLEMVRMKYKKR